MSFPRQAGSLSHDFAIGDQSDRAFLDGVTREFGPFDSYDQALADMQADDEESAAEPGETLQEAELEIGIADWIDPDTGEPAEGQSTPHLQDE